MNWNLGRKLISTVGISILVTFAVLSLLVVSSMPASGQACAAQNWTAATPNIWASDGGVKVMLNDDPATNRPTIPIYADDGAYNPWGFEQAPQPMPQLNPVWSCPSGTPVIAIAGAGRETVSFQVYVTAGVGANSSLGSVNLDVSPLSGPGATIASDNTGSSSVTRYLEGYVPYTSPGPYSPTNLQSTGQMPDPLIPFYDPYDAGNPAVATPFNVQSGTTQAVWVNVTIPANQLAGAYTGTVTVTGSGVGTVEIPVTLTVWNGNLPTFDAGSVNSTYADMLKTWLPFYRGNLDGGEGMPYGGPGDSQEQALYQKYQVMGHNYDIDLQIDVDGPANSGCYPSWGSCTSFTTDGTTSSIDWTAYDAYVGPALTPGGLFSDGTNMRTFDSPLSTAGGGAWVGGGWNWTEQNGGAAPPPAGMLQLVTNYASQISQHFAANHLSKGWGVPELISYTFDETYNPYHSKDIGGNERIYEIISSYNAAINTSNSAQSATWDPSTFPVRTFLTDAPHCQEQGDNPDFTDLACSDHIDLSYPGAANSTAGYTNSWVADWTPNASLFMPGQPGPALNYGWTAPPTPLTMGTGYQYTFDLTLGVPALSTAPAPVERWTYLGGDPFTGGVGPGANAVGPRVNYWIAYKYGLDVTVPSVGNPNPPPTPGGVWIWVGDWWSGYEGGATPTGCASSAPSPFVTASDGDDGVVFYPGNEVGCYYTDNPVGQAALTASPAVNTTCTGLGYNVCNGISGPVASIRMEEMRRGYEDYEYLYLLGKQSGRATALAIANSIGSDGITSWDALNWENVDGSWYAMGLLPISDAYTGNCTDPTPGAGGLAAGLPNGPTGAASSGPQFNYGGCAGLWSSDPSVYEAARVQMAQALGFAPASAAPSITGLSPSNGSPAGGTSVQITGTNFTGATEVQFGGVEAASFTVNSSTSITAVTPAGIGTVDVQVFGPGGGSLPNSSDQYDYSLVTVTGVSPNLGTDEGGNAVTITGTYFSTGATVMFGSTAAINVVVNSSTSITATAPAGSGSVNVTVSSLQGASEANSSDVYSYEPPPTLTSLSVSSGPISGGTSVTISGTGFVSGMTVSFGGNQATDVVVASDTSLTATSPVGPSIFGGIVNVLVTTVNGTSAILSADQFNYISPVTVTGLSVQTGPTGGGTQVVITGTDFTGATAVLFGNNAATSFTVNSATQITATSPAGGGTVDVIVITPLYGSAAVYADEFSYTAAVASGSFTTLPTTEVGSTSSPQNAQLTLTSATPISGITVPPAQNGVPEFTIGAVSGCTVGGASNPSGAVCTVPVTFSPQYPGIRTGTLTFTNNGEVIGTAGLAGIGLGPEAAVTPGSLVMAIGGGANQVTSTPQSVATAAIGVTSNFAALAMDGAGNLYISDNTHCLAYKVTAATNQIAVVAGNYTGAPDAVTPSTTPEPAIGSNTCPAAIAVDGAGNIYLVDSNIQVNVPYNGTFPGAVEEVSAATGEIVVIAGNPNSNLTATTTPQPALNVAIWAANSLATDTAGNLYISDFFNNVVDKVTPDGQIVVVAGSGVGGGGPFTTPQAATSVSLNGPTGMVVDEFGNLYISDQNINLVEMVNASGQIVTVAGGGGNAPSSTPQAALSIGFNAPGGLAVDGAGDLYIADILNEEIEQLNLAGQLVVVAGGGTTIPSATIESSLSAQLGAIQGVEVDGAGNIYIADGQTIGNGNNMVETVSTVGAPMSFPYTNVQTSSAPQSFTLTNIGNQSLVLSSLSVAADYPLQATGCTVTANSGETLPSSNNCSLTYVFEPNYGGVLDESAILTDNNLNAANAQQTLALTGSATGGTLATPTVTVTLAPTSITTAEALTATIGVSEGPGSPMVTGSVTLTGGAYTSLEAQLVNGAAQIDVPVGSLAAGAYPLAVNYVPDANSSATYLNATGYAPVTVVPANFTITGTSVTVVSGATTGNTSSITITPVGWYSGTITLQCSITPVPANNPATCNIQPDSITLSGTTAETTTLTVNTYGTASSLNPSNKLPWLSAGGAALALVFLFGIPARRRTWRTMLGMALLFLAICTAVPGCGGTSSNTTPPGLYAVTVTGTSGGTDSTGFVVLKVQ